MKEHAMSYDNQNIFAKIIRGEIPCDKVYEDDYVLAFNDITPQAPIHILVIPKNAYVSLEDFSVSASAEEITAFHRAISQIIKDAELSENGFRAIANAGDHGGQEVPHYHLHILGGEKLGAMVGD
jgi:diadenosine tetraphosphate (Ap4A) HIT family hydrolase